MTVREYNIRFPREQIEAFCRRHPIARLSLLGSVLRDDFGEESDVDFLVEFVPGSRPTYFTLAELEMELEEIVGRKVDVRTPLELNPRFRENVLASAELLYARE